MLELRQQHGLRLIGAILIKFRAPIDDEDPSVDLIVALTREDEPGLWIPNREQDFGTGRIR